MSADLCVKRVGPRGVYSSYPCGKPGKVEHDGKWYCGRHDPERIAERRAARDAEYASKTAALTLRRTREAQQQRDIEAVVRALAGCSDVAAMDAGLYWACAMARAIVAEWDAEREARA